MEWHGMWGMRWCAVVFGVISGRVVRVSYGGRKAYMWHRTFSSLHAREGG